MQIIEISIIVEIQVEYRNRGEKADSVLPRFFGIFIALTRFQGFPLYSQGFGIPGIRLFPLVFISVVSLFF
jgi:hypothetical protein